MRRASIRSNLEKAIKQFEEQGGKVGTNGRPKECARRQGKRGEQMAKRCLLYGALQTTILPSKPYLSALQQAADRTASDRSGGGAGPANGKAQPNQTA